MRGGLWVSCTLHFKADKRYIDILKKKVRSKGWLISRVMSDAWCQMSHILSLMSDVRREMSEVLCQMSDVWWLMSNIWCPMSDVWCQTSDVLCQMSDVWCQMSLFWCQASDVPCPKCPCTLDIRLRTLDIWHHTSVHQKVRCLMFEVWEI